VLENSSPLLKHSTGTLIGDGRFELIFVSGNGYKTIRGDRVETIRPGIYIGGQMDAPMELEIDPATTLYALKLEPWAAQLLSGFDFREALNKTVDLQHINATLYKELNAYDPSNQMEQIIEKLLIHFENAKAFAKDEKIINACCKILDTGYIDFKQSRDHYLLSTNLTSRSIENKFKHALGVTPQQYANGIRLRRISEAIKLQPKFENFTELSYSHGFYDQAHFNRVFKNYWGFAPKMLPNEEVFITDSKERFRYYTI